MLRKQNLTEMFRHFDRTLGGRKPTLAEVAAQCDGEYSQKYLRGIRLQYKQRCELRNDPEAEALAARFRSIPMLIELRAAGKQMGLNWSVSRYQAIRQLIAESNASDDDSDQEKLYHLRLQGVDVELFEKVVAMLGTSRPETLALLTKSFLIASFNMQINPLEVVRQASHLSARDARRMSKVLDVNLKGLLG